jgi:hypothetical protein
MNDEPQMPMHSQPKVRRLWITASVAACAVVAGLILAPRQTWPAVMLAGFYAVGLGLGAALALAMTDVCKATWFTAIRRVPEALFSTLPLAAAAMLLLLIVGARWVYPWADLGAHHSTEPAMQFWWTPGVVFARAAVCLAIWILITGAMLRAAPGRTYRRSIVFLLLFAPTLSLASFDWIMSVQSHWFSTIFGVYCFAGVLTSSLAAVTLAVIVLRRTGPLRHIASEAHLHDLGKFLFAFCTFWAYIWFSQAMLIWYANITEETAFYIVRGTRGWQLVMVASLALNWAIPFASLISIRAKRSETVLARVCGLVLIGHWVDLYWLMAPPTTQPGFIATLWHVVPMIATGAAMLALFIRALHRRGVMPGEQSGASAVVAPAV